MIFLILENMLFLLSYQEMQLVQFMFYFPQRANLLNFLASNFEVSFALNVDLISEITLKAYFTIILSMLTILVIFRVLRVSIVL